MEKALYEQLLTYFKFTPTPDQESAFQKLILYLVHEARYEGFLLTGSAGTGKTTMLNALIRLAEDLQIRVVLMAPTGRAAKVMSQKTFRPAATIHKTIYAAERKESGGWNFRRINNTITETIGLFIVDEASMISTLSTDSLHPQDILRDLIDYVFQNQPYHKLLLLGDTAQLPPVGNSQSIALQPDLLKQRYGITMQSIELQTVKRQSMTSGILANAIQLRRSLNPFIHVNENTPTKSAIQLPVLSKKKDVVVLESYNDLIETFLYHFDVNVFESAIVICYSNKLAAQINEAIRYRLFGFDYEEKQLLMPNDWVMMVKNYYSKTYLKLPFIANGEIAKVASVNHNSKHAAFGLNWCEITIDFATEDSDESMLVQSLAVLDLLNNKEASLSKDKMLHIWESRMTQRKELGLAVNKLDMREDEYISAFQLKYGYCITGHKAQGGQWNQVIVCFEPYLFDSTDTQKMIELLRWSYTAVTRATKKLYLLNCPFEIC